MEKTASPEPAVGQVWRGNSSGREYTIREIGKSKTGIVEYRIRPVGYGHTYWLSIHALVNNYTYVGG
jgi:hypothetical protein